MDERLDTAGAVADLAGTRQISLLEPGDPDRIGPYHLLCRLPRGGQGADVFVACGNAGSFGMIQEAREQGLSVYDALVLIGEPGEAVSTEPFLLQREQQAVASDD